MNKYYSMTDFEINKLVIQALKLVVPLGYPHNADNRSVGVVSHGEYLWYDYCNNPSEAWPIIKKYRIGLAPSVDVWHAYSPEEDFVCTLANPLRAAMIVFLMMKEFGND